MRIYDEAGTEALVAELGEVPNIHEAIQGVLDGLNIQDPRTITSEKVFFDTHRLVADNPKFFRAEEHQALFDDRRKLSSIAAPIIRFLEPKFPNCTPVLVQIATLPPHSELLYHVDCYLYQSVSHKIHIPLYTNSGALFQTIGNDDVMYDFHFEVGRCYEINNIMYHRAVNRGDEPRAHLILDFMENKAIEDWERDGVDFFFTHHRKNKVLEFQAADRIRRRPK